MGKIIPLLMAVFGLAAGVGAGVFLRPPPTDEVVINPCGEGEQDKAVAAEDEEDTSVEFVKINNQFVVPVVKDDQVDSLVVMSLSIEIATGGRESVYQREPKLRDEFLQVMFNHANNGGFEGKFTQPSRLENLRSALREVARAIVGDSVKDVLVTNIVRQDV